MTKQKQTTKQKLPTKQTTKQPISNDSFKSN